MKKNKSRIEVAVQIAKNVGKVLIKYFGKLSSFEQKGVVDFLTEADKASEKMIIDEIKKLFPEDTILTEESGTFSGKSGYTWIVDPLDGTTNFVHSYQIFCVSIGIEHNGSMAAGVVYCPATKELFMAEEGKGAYVNNIKIRVSKVESLANSLLATGFPYYRREVINKLLEKVRIAIMNAHGIRRSGVASYDLCCVASGRIDGFWEEGLKPWDLAAGSLMVREAGGILTDYSLGEYSIYGKETLASNGLIHEELARTLFKE